MSNDLVIKVEGLWKQYRYGTISHRTMRKDLQSWWARFRGKDNPNAPISSNLSPFTDNVSLGDDRFWALKDVSFEVKRGEVLGIIGKNGAGKSTLLKIMSRVTTPTKGQIKIKGRVASLLEVGTGFHPELTGRENIYLNGAILGMTKAEIKKKFDEIVAFAEIEKFIDTPVKRYSSGMYVRLAFAVAAHLEPEILIIDEVLAVGDIHFQKKCIGKMEEVGKLGKTVIFVSHNMSIIRNLCNHGILLSAGLLVNEGSIGKIVDEYESMGRVDNSPIWVNTDKHDMNEIACIEKVEVYNSVQQLCTSFLNSEDILLKFTIRLKEEINNLKVGFDLVKDGNIVFRSQHVDSHGSEKKLSKGENILSCRIPDRFLTLGDYYLIPLLTIHCVRNLTRITETVMKIHVVLDTSKSEYLVVLNEQNHPGVVFPLLVWEAVSL